MTELDQEGHMYPVHCCACLNMDGKRVPAKWLTPEGYFTCEPHAGLPIAELIETAWGRKGAT